MSIHPARLPLLMLGVLGLMLVAMAGLGAPTVAQSASAPAGPAAPAAAVPVVAPDKAAAMARAQAAGMLFIAADMVQGSKNIPSEQADSRSCVLTSRFPRNSEMVWRARVFDPATGALMDDKALSKLEARLANGQTVDMRYGAHPPRGGNQEYYWTGSWVVPKDYPTGTLRYTIVATAVDGRSGTWEPFIVEASLPAVTDEVLPDA